MKKINSLKIALAVISVLSFVRLQCFSQGNEEGIVTFRNLIAQKANENIGAHYLWGSAGAIPGVGGGTVSKNNNVSFEATSTGQSAPYIFTANCDVKGHHTCGGRFQEIGSIIGDLNSEDYVDYISALDNSKPEEWTSRNGLTPRKVLDPENPGYNNKIVWGEDCRNVRHFDCVGFINYCVEKAKQELRGDETQQVSYEISGWASDNSCTQSVSKNDGPANGDILIKGDNKHIGMTIIVDGELKVIQASQTSQGVILSNYNPDEWSDRRRILPCLLTSNYPPK